MPVWSDALTDRVSPLHERAWSLIFLMPPEYERTAYAFKLPYFSLSIGIFKTISLFGAVSIIPLVISSFLARLLYLFF